MSWSFGDVIFTEVVYWLLLLLLTVNMLTIISVMWTVQDIIIYSVTKSIVIASYGPWF